MHIKMPMDIDIREEFFKTLNVRLASLREWLDCFGFEDAKAILIEVDELCQFVEELKKRKQ